MRWIFLVAFSAFLLACAEGGGPVVNGLNGVSPDPGTTPLPGTGPTPGSAPTLTPPLVSDTFNDVLGPGDDECVGLPEARPCRRYMFSSAAGGTLRLTLEWSGLTDLDIELWRGSNRLISVTGSGTTETLTAELAPGSYEVRVIHRSGNVVQNYRLQITRPV